MAGTGPQHGAAREKRGEGRVRPTPSTIVLGARRGFDAEKSAQAFPEEHNTEFPTHITATENPKALLETIDPTRTNTPPPPPFYPPPRHAPNPGQPPSPATATPPTPPRPIFDRNGRQARNAGQPPCRETATRPTAARRGPSRAAVERGAQNWYHHPFPQERNKAL